MDSTFWSRVHGGATHFPIALIFVSAFFDGVGFYLNRSARAQSMTFAGYLLVILSALGCVGSVVTGLALSKWQIGGTGLLLRHHLAVWPAVGLIIGLGTWRCLVRNNPSRTGFAIYLCVAGVACALIALAGFFGGEMLIGH